jgi:hypothetical protein
MNALDAVTECQNELIYKTFIVCNNCAELSHRLISLYNGAEKFKNTCNRGQKKKPEHNYSKKSSALGLALYTVHGVD